MKDFMSKIKTLDYKQFALDHGEKIGIGIVGLTVGVICLFLTSWASDFTGEPRDMEKKAEGVTDQLRLNGWTEERKKEFPYLLAENELPKVERPLDLANFEWLVDPSPKLYQRAQPAEECDWIPVADLLAASGRGPLSIAIEPPPQSAEEEPKPAKSDKAASRKKDKGEELKLPPMAAAGMADFGGVSTEKASGRRFVVVTGVIEVRRQEKALMSAQRAGSLSEVRDRLNYRGMKLQRQRAVPGPDPWPKDEASWKDVNTESSIEAL